MGSTALQIYAQEYFNSLNPIAERISVDVASTVSAYEDLWQTLSEEDQKQVLDETIIHPEAVLKYSVYPQNDLEIEYFPRLRLETGFKYVTDDDGDKEHGVKWRDEHSAPFSWMTRSQLNLSVITQQESETKKSPKLLNNVSVVPMKKISVNDSFDPPDVVLGGSSKLASAVSPKLKFPPKSYTGEDGLLTKLKNKTTVLKIQTTLKSAMGKSGSETINRVSVSEKETLVPSKINCSVTSGTRLAKPISNKPQISKPKTPPPPPPVKPKMSTEPNTQTDPERKTLLPEVPSSNQSSSVSSEKTVSESKSLNSVESADLGEFCINLHSPSKDVPKTGFDFLDNW